MRYPIDNDHFIDIENTITEDHNEATLFLLPVLVKSKMLLLHIKKISPTIFEFAYICQLTLWSCAEIEELSRETCQLAEEMLQKSSDELHDYYVNDMHMNNYAARQAELIKIVRLADFVFRDKKQLMAANQVFNFIEHNLRLTVLT
uniref:NR LBD domain-containing protein n=1 Tax=Panagrolaimus davidi TaxID=227884 RepID=A0A914R059_9BILA